MDMKANTILITGGSSGIGRGLAEAFHNLGNQVIIAGRREAALKEVTDANPGMRSASLDLVSAEGIQTFARHITTAYPNLNVLINNGGVQRPENLLEQPDDLAAMNEEVSVNLLGQIRLTAALLPLLRSQVQSTVMNVTSGLAFVPLAAVPTYCATKAALHSYTVSLRYQLKETTTHVVEIIPPQVQTSLSSTHAQDPRAMPLADFITEVMTILQDDPSVDEVVVDRCKPIRFAAEQGKFNDMFKAFNQRT